MYTKNNKTTTKVRSKNIGNKETTNKLTTRTSSMSTTLSYKDSGDDDYTN